VCNTISNLVVLVVRFILGEPLNNSVIACSRLAKSECQQWNVQYCREIILLLRATVILHISYMQLIGRNVR
jgi:hypothetical protein